LKKSLASTRHQALIEFLILKRREAGLSQAELAIKLDEYQSFVARLESGQRRIDVIELIEIADILSFDPSILVRQLAKGTSSGRRKA
jgi:transcriptional regulator with XRE-family HTH domain